MTLTREEIQARLSAREQQAAAPSNVEYKYVRPFGEAADALIDVVRNAEGRWMFGIPEIDTCIRGIGRGELMYVTGRAHSGKTQLVLQSIVNNPDARVVFFTPDEVGELVLTKLIGISHGLNAETLERDIKAGDQEVVDLVRRVAKEEFKNLVVIDDTLGFDQMSVALQEAEHFWGGRSADCVVIDFLELLPGDGESSGVTWKSQNLKRWTKKHNVPMICLHQASRSSGQRGQSAGMSAMRYGGETEAIFVLEVFRKVEDPDLDEFDRRKHATTVSVAVVKNKRPPSRKGEWDLFIHPDCGAIRTLRPGDSAVGKPESALDALRQRSFWKGEQE